MPPRCIEETLFHAKLWLLAAIPTSIGVIFSVPAIFAWFQIETAIVGISNVRKFLNRTEKSGICESEEELNSIGVFLVASLSHIFLDLYLFSLFAPYKKGAENRLIAAICVTLVVDVAIFSARDEEQPIPLGIVIVVVFLKFWSPDVVRSIIQRNLKKTLKVTSAAFRTAVIQMISGGLTIAMLTISLHGTSVPVIDSFILGACYPVLTLFFRVVIRRLVSKIFKSGNVFRSRLKNLKVESLINEVSVTFFLVPEFVSIFMLEEMNQFVPALCMQMLIESICAVMFSKFVLGARNARVTPHTSSKSKIQNLARLGEISTRMGLGDNEKWAGLIFSTILGEKRALLIGGILSSFITPAGVAEFKTRIWIAIIVETLSDFGKVKIYTRNGLLKTGAHPRHSLKDTVPMSLFISVALFTNLLGLLLRCYAKE